MLLVWLLVLILGVAWLAHRRASPLKALGIVAVYLVLMSLFSHAHGWRVCFWLAGKARRRCGLFHA